VSHLVPGNACLLSLRLYYSHHTWCSSKALAAVTAIANLTQMKTGERDHYLFCDVVCFQVVCLLFELLDECI